MAKYWTLKNVKKSKSSKCRMYWYFVSFEMFTSQARIDRKTGPDDLGRFEYLQALVTEFQDTDRQGIHSMAYKLSSNLGSERLVVKTLPNPTRKKEKKKPSDHLTITRPQQELTKPKKKYHRAYNEVK